MRLWRHSNHWSTDGGTAMLCASGFNRVVVFEDRANIRHIEAIFTKTNKGDHDYFTIKIGLGQTRVEESNQGLLWGASNYLQRQYNAGYRYLHFEAVYE